ncbi:hypothetical protein BC628DRAFT_92684 [Trametes gibbosa]|nr:hypothetical protein BC628DRAFT_680222 [Trametes gibbosa]KAI0828135.1 hypothetical protein BC628DRAFT_92684 [Trametes gibbosa]
MSCPASVSLASATSSRSSLPEDNKHEVLLSNARLPADTKVLALAHVRIYQSAFGASVELWRFTGLRGLLVFTENQATDEPDLGSISPHDIEESRWFRLVDVDTGKGVIWRHQIPALLDYRADKPFFHVFSGCSRMFGFRFDEDLDAERFHKRVTERVRIAAPLRPKLRPARSASPASSIASRLPRKAVSPSMISAPTPGTFVHVAHVGVSGDGRIEASANVDPGWTTLLEELQGYGVNEKMVTQDLDFVQGFIAGARASLAQELEAPAVMAARTPSIAGAWTKGRLSQRKSLKRILGVAGA